MLLDVSAATNLVGQPHTFTATVQQTAVPNPTEADWTAVPDGTTLIASTSGSGAIDVTSTCLTAGTPRDVHLHGSRCRSRHARPRCVGDRRDDDRRDDVPEHRTHGARVRRRRPGFRSRSRSRRRRATNIVGEPHTFTVTVDVLGADGTSTPFPADGATVTWTFDGPGTLDAAATTCDEGTTAGTCAIVFTNGGAAGAGVAHDHIGDVQREQPELHGRVRNDRARPGDAPPPIAATKAWTNSRVTVSPDTAQNFVGEPHTFTVLVERDTGDGQGFQPLADAPVDLGTTGTATPTPAVPTTCTTDAAGMHDHDHVERSPGRST